MSSLYYVALSIVALLVAQSIQIWPLSGSGNHVNTQFVFREACIVSHYTAYETYDTPIDFRSEPLDPFNGPKLNPPNKTAGEQWEFDGIGQDAKTGVMMGFYRDPNYAILGTGNFRVSIDILLENGTIYSQDHHLAHSIVEICEDTVHGTWFSPDAKYTFAVARDNSYARIEIDTKNIKGSFEIKSTSPARYPDGKTFPNEDSTTRISPFFHWIEPIPTGKFTVDLVAEGTSVLWEGLGGSERLWTPFSWFTVLEGLNFVRAEVGPYQLTFCATKAHLLTPSETYAAAYLAENGKPIFSANIGYISKSENYVTLSKKYGGEVTGGLADKSTGHVLNLVSPADGKHWHFVFDHTAVSFEFALGEGTGGSGFAAKATGGELDKEKFEGVGLVEQLIFPKDSLFFKSNYVK
jgi:hypothetical protein